MSKRDRKLEGSQKGAQQHAEGQHGEKAHARFVEQLHQPMRDDPDDNVIHSDTTGEHRLFENREQHDEAEKNSEHNRLNAEQQKRGGGRSDDVVVNGLPPNGGSV